MNDGSRELTHPYSMREREERDGPGREEIKGERERERRERGRERERGGKSETESQYVRGGRGQGWITNLNFMRNIAIGEFLDANGSHS